MASFQVFDQTYARDESKVYLDGAVLSGADAVTFQPLDRPGLAKDAHHVYLRDVPIGDAGPASFRVLGGAYATDGQRVFYFADRIPDARLASFRPLEGPYASDAERVYWIGKAIEGADPATYRVLNADFEYSADAEHAYYRQTVIAGAEPSTFPPGRAVTGCAETSITFAG
ncbi:MAG: hypothetical protein QOC69_322 [Mycobacterium sp.]|nr:hypothetical protein [Mycobacterium sp.]